MYEFIFPSKTTWISSGSNVVLNTKETDQNFGKDQILELKKEFEDLSFKYRTRVLCQFVLSSVSASVARWKSGQRIGDVIPPPTSAGQGYNQRANSRWYLKLYEAEGNKGSTEEYKLTAFPISQSWDEGIGSSGDSPKVTDGASWKYRLNPDNGAATHWKEKGKANNFTSSGAPYLTGSGYEASQSFSNQSPDIEMDVTNIVDKWLVGSASNNGFLLTFSGSQETNQTTFGNLKFFSRNTTIYAPKLEARWDNHAVITGSSTGSMTPVTMSGNVDNYIYSKGLRESYREDEKVKFRFGLRKRYITKSFSTSVQTTSGSYIPEGSSSYSIKDVATGETIIPFSPYTSMSCDSDGNYFIQKLNGFYPNRRYQILIKVDYNDGQKHIFAENFEFKVVR